jgi:succinyl-CoA:acetate CoA-transferase
VPYFRCPPEKIVAVVPTHSPDRNSPFKPPDTVSGVIADRVVDFLSGQVKRGRLPATLPLSSTNPQLGVLSKCWPAEILITTPHF